MMILYFFYGPVRGHPKLKKGLATFLFRYGIRAMMVFIASFTHAFCVAWCSSSFDYLERRLDHFQNGVTDRRD
eukprot:scaffold2747_cov104-Cylindrotheca_fusiformis.AAC.16